MSRAAVIALVLVACAVAGACSSDPRSGYAFATTHDPHVRTIAVPIFENRTFSTGMEARLTEAVVKEIQRTTPWRIVRSGEAATTLRGAITGSDLESVTRQRATGLVQEQGVRITVEFEWIDNRTGQPLVSRRNFSALATFVPYRGVQERLEVGQNEAIRELSRDIVAELRANW